MDSFYDDPEVVKDHIRRGRHRQLIGGAWDEIGQLQFDFLVGQGLQPSHVLLDVGAGAFRAGVRLIPYLDPGNYWAIDKSALLLQAGWDLELKRARLTDRQPRDQIVALEDFEFDRLGATFDFAIAQSLFTHLSLNRIRRCLARLAPSMRPGGRLFATFFEIDASADPEQDHVHAPSGVVSHSDRTFYHYTRADFDHLVARLPWRIDYIGEWGHPRGQRMLGFVRV
ncbi:class I SAM-dependent methyltransferase [Sphingomonas donggukensis]|uniref:Class I SAM-dependent methyltransferase n=1 Tax=Sphingomonas donggukensis TaxID=2949093 RepID=A0ABY4TQP4_9SPHN|nr:class I SAM-dependent methyltransferase [Sphingomonas donggukensis]URW74690.1 class I SAM-dependent methyltransferase [Sphingomonas donggukensis]